jgi:hypothetical protein
MTRRVLTAGNIINFPEGTYATGCPLGKDKIERNKSIQMGDFGHRVFVHLMRANKKIFPDAETVRELDKQGVLRAKSIFPHYVRNPVAVESSNYPDIHEDERIYLERILGSQIAGFTEAQLKARLDEESRIDEAVLTSLYTEPSDDCSLPPFCLLEKLLKAPFSKFNLGSKIDYATLLPLENILKADLFEVKILTKRPVESLTEILHNRYRKKNAYQLEAQKHTIKGNTTINNILKDLNLDSVLVSRNLVYLHTFSHDFTQIGIPDQHSSSLTRGFLDLMYQAWSLKKKCYGCVKGERDGNRYLCGVEVE